MSIKPAAFAITAAAMIVGLSGCGSSDITAGSAATSDRSSMPSPTTSASAMSTSPTTAPSASSPAAKPVLITIKDFKFSVPASVAPGSKVTVKNEDSENHTVTSTTHGAFDVQANAVGTATFTAPAKLGTYPFTCTFHATMMGKLVVK